MSSSDFKPAYNKDGIYNHEWHQRYRTNFEVTLDDLYDEIDGLKANLRQEEDDSAYWEEKFYDRETEIFRLKEENEALREQVAELIGLKKIHDDLIATAQELERS